MRLTLGAGRGAGDRMPRLGLDDRWVLVVFLVVLTLHVVFVVVGANTDDALITFRYAERLAAGDGFTYNDGERVLGTTTPLFTLLLAAAAALGAPPPAFADAINPVLGALTAALVYVLLGRAWGLAAARFAVVLLISSPLFLRSASYGMETPLFCALIVVALHFLGAGRSVAAGIALGLACLTRPEGALLGAAMLPGLVRRPRELVKLVLPAALVVLPWIVFASLYFGSPLPHSLQAKLVHAARPGVLETARFLFAESPHRIAVTLLGAVGAIEVGAALTARLAPGAGRALAAGGLFALLYVAFYLIGRPTPYEWYLPPLQLVLVSLGGVAMAVVARRAGAMLPGSVGGARAEGASLFAVVLIGCSVLLPHTFAQARIWRERVDSSFIPLAAWIDAHAPSDARVFTGDIGYVGYHTRREILDASALVSPRVLDVRLGGKPANAIVASDTPEVLVFPVQPNSFPIAWPDAATRERYRAMARFPAGRPLEMTPEEAADWFRMQGDWKPDYVVYVRRDLP